MSNYPDGFHGNYYTDGNDPNSYERWIEEFYAHLDLINKNRTVKEVDSNLLDEYFDDQITPSDAAFHYNGEVLENECA
jgi:hypothetical protein